ncbi:hypothetical protein CO661_30550 [Sinorhizobium fredii]|uniref:Uncharacterized protein n=1 Tax=Rhizobium fredii TaxID=380 RepID=A0A2A6LPI3_RHIFR|nr:hypothetical protein [Sinorhizobium fredii]MQX10940.1 hypothetical protein [Sinorhizobium fredii]PDT44210.1 hypothetical protein CO661_30550 [Sinorhizobium fredii]UTY47994.1 hypothetical protein EPK84_15050 [Sinorhizobium fredii]
MVARSRSSKSRRPARCFASSFLTARCGSTPSAPRAARESSLQRRAPYQARKGRCSTLNCCMSLSLDRGRCKETCSSSGAVPGRAFRLASVVAKMKFFAERRLQSPKGPFRGSPRKRWSPLQARTRSSAG